MLSGLLLVVSAGQARAEWASVTGNLNEADIRWAVSDPTNAAVMLAASERRVYRSVDGGQNWRQVFGMRGDSDRVWCIEFDRFDSRRLYAGTDKGLKISEDGGRRWSLLVPGIGENDRSVRCVAIEGPKRAWVGTANGLYELALDGRVFTKVSTLPAEVVHSLHVSAGTPSAILAATDKGIFLSRDRAKSWQAVCRKNGENEAASTTALEQFDIEEFAAAPFYSNLAFAPAQNRYYAATREGMMAAAADAVEWKKLDGQNLPDSKINFVDASSGTLFAATDRGVFRWDAAENRFIEVYEGFLSKEVRQLSYNPKGDYLLAATRKGVYLLAHPGWDRKAEVVPVLSLPGPSKESPGVLERFSTEPTIREVQDAAVRYAEVHPDKIAAWRSAAMKKAWLPTLSVDSDLSRDQNVDLDRGGTNDPDRFITGPVEESRDWSVGLSWDLGELVWNGDQTSIDTRSKLMVELRDDILSEVTHLYFERRRLQVQIALNSDADPAVAIERQIRLEELTAGIDGLTGGYLSRKTG